MDKETLSHYGWIVILVLILSVLLALATPFGNFLAEGFSAAYHGFVEVSTKAMDFVGLSDGEFGIDESENIDPSNTIKFYQPYQYTENGQVVLEVVFHEDGNMDVYMNAANEGGTIQDVAEYGDGKMLFMGEEVILEESGTKFSLPIAEGTMAEFVLKPTKVNYIYYGTEYLSENNDFSLCAYLEKNGSMEFYVDGNLEFSTGTNEVTYYSRDFYYDGQKWAVYPDGTRFIMFGMIFDADCIHSETEIRDKTEEYTGDEYCIQCGRLIKEGTKIYKPGEKVPGLYATGSNYQTLLKSWDELLKEEIVYEDGTFAGAGVFDSGPSPKSIRPYASAPSNSSAEYLVGDILFPEHITGIVPEGFIACDKITGLWFGKNMSYISQDAFSGCSSITRVIGMESVTHIGRYAFSSCESLKEFKFGNSLKEIGEYAFAGCSIENVTIPAGVEEMYSTSFECETLKSITVDVNNQYYITSDGILYTKGFETLMLCPAGNNITNLIVPDSVKLIDASAFMNVQSLQSVVIGSRVTEISYQAFSQCGNLKTVTIKGSPIIDSYAFYNCRKLSSIDFGGTTKIASSAFYNCDSLTSITLPSTLTHLDYQSFGYCDNLRTVDMSKTKVVSMYQTFNGTHLDTIYLPKTITSLGYYTFSDNSTTIYYDGTYEKWSKIKLDKSWRGSTVKNYFTIECSDTTFYI